MAASEPTSSLSKVADTLHPLALNRHFGTLTAVWVVPLSESKFTPESPFPGFCEAGIFGVGQRTDPFRGLNPRSVSLPFRHSPPGLDCGQFRQEPAIAGLDWLFTPSHRSWERLSTEPLQASTRFYPRFTLPTARSPGFGSCPSNFRRFHTPPLASCGLVAFAPDAPFQVILATQAHSLARYSKRTAELRRALPYDGC